MKVVVVDKNDNVIGAMNRADAIRQGKIVRIARIFLFNSKGELFLQKRGPNVDFPNLWDQSAAGHVDEGEDYLTAAKREMKEEIGLSGVPLTEVAKFYMDIEHVNGKFNRFNMIYTAKSDKPLTLDQKEAVDGKWMTMADIDKMISESPEELTQGFIRAYSVFKSSKK